MDGQARHGPGTPCATGHTQAARSPQACTPGPARASRLTPHASRLSCAHNVPPRPTPRPTNRAYTTAHWLSAPGQVGMLRAHVGSTQKWF